MVALRCFYADDAEQDAQDIVRAERDLERLRYAEPKSEGHAEKIRVAVAVTECELERMRRAA